VGRRRARLRACLERARAGQSRLSARRARDAPEAPRSRLRTSRMSIFSTLMWSTSRRWSLAWENTTAVSRSGSVLPTSSPRGSRKSFSHPTRRAVRGRGGAAAHLDLAVLERSAADDEGHDRVRRLIGEPQPHAYQLLGRLRPRASRSAGSAPGSNPRRARQSNSSVCGRGWSEGCSTWPASARLSRSGSGSAGDMSASERTWTRRVHLVRGEGRDVSS